jgi:hypothetical protein
VSTPIVLLSVNQSGGETSVQPPVSSCHKQEGFVAALQQKFGSSERFAIRQFLKLPINPELG